jgi:hypothetical protein
LREALVELGALKGMGLPSSRRADRVLTVQRLTPAGDPAEQLAGSERKMAT